MGGGIVRSMMIGGSMVLVLSEKIRTVTDHTMQNQGLDGCESEERNMANTCLQMPQERHHKKDTTRKAEEEHKGPRL